jgi:hypothetical protein
MFRRRLCRRDEPGAKRLRGKILGVYRERRVDRQESAAAIACRKRGACLAQVRL